MEMKTNPPLSFERTLWVHWFQFLSYTAQDVEHGKGTEVEKRKKKATENSEVWTQYNPKIPQNLIWIAFPRKNHLILSFRMLNRFNEGQIFVFQPVMTKNAAKLPWYAHINLLLILLFFWRSPVEPNLLNRMEFNCYSLFRLFFIRELPKLSDVLFIDETKYYFSPCTMGSYRGALGAYRFG